MTGSDDLWKSMRSAEPAKAAPATSAETSRPAPAAHVDVDQVTADVFGKRAATSPHRPATEPGDKAAPTLSLAKWAAIGVLVLLVIAIAAWALLSGRSKPQQPTIKGTSQGAVPVSTAPPSPAAAPATTPATTPPAPVRGSLLNLNAATSAQLQAIAGIGPALAQRIIDKRAALGGKFRSWDDVDAVEGIGPKLLETLKASASVE
jgi:competence protein ComEA